MKLYFLRHGEAEYTAASDFERELTDKGQEDSTTIGIFCRKKNIYFTHCLVSPLTRAQQTARAVLQQLPPVTIEETNALTPDSDPKNLFNQLRSNTNESRLLLVTHEPFASTCISTLISGSEATRIIMKQCSFACVETDGVPSRGNGKLLWLINPDVLASLI